MERLFSTMNGILRSERYGLLPENVDALMILMIVSIEVPGIADIRVSEMAPKLKRPT